MKKNSLLFTLIFAISIISNACFAQTCNPDQWITIFIHGIVSLRPFLNISNIIKLARDDIENSTYEHAAWIIRKDPFFFQYHAMQDIG